MKPCQLVVVSRDAALGAKLPSVVGKQLGWECRFWPQEFPPVEKSHCPPGTLFVLDGRTETPAFLATWPELRRRYCDSAFVIVLNPDQQEAGRWFLRRGADACLLDPDAPAWVVEQIALAALERRRSLRLVKKVRRRSLAHAASARPQSTPRQDYRAQASGPARKQGLDDSTSRIPTGFEVLARQDQGHKEAGPAQQVARAGRLEKLLARSRHQARQLRARLRLALDEIARLSHAALAGERARYEFVAHINHEFRTPANTVVGAAELLETTVLDEEQQELVKIAKGGALELVRRVDSLLQYVNAELRPFTEEHFALKALLDSLVMEARAQAENRGLRFHYHRLTELPCCLYGSGPAIRLLAWHLLENALKFTQEGCVVLSAGLSPGKGGQSRLQLRIRDTGRGTSEPEQGHIFDVFRTGSQVASEPGLGLGLAVARRLALQLGARLTFRSIPGEGSIFEVDIPVRVCDCPVRSPSA